MTYTTTSNDDSTVTVDNGADSFRIQPLGDLEPSERWRLGAAIARDLIQVWETRDELAKAQRELRLISSALETARLTLLSMQSQLDSLQATVRRGMK